MNDEVPGLSPAEGRLLLDLARQSIARAAARGPSGVLTDAERAELPPALLRPAAAFVTLKTVEGGVERLRGCIGLMEPDRPLADAVVGMAAQAATGDPRFLPVTPDEVTGLRISLSVLRPTRPLERLDDLVLGRMGIVLERDGRRAVFLPQVAVETGWDRDRLLGELARKAGLPADAWRTARLSVFETEAVAEPRTAQSSGGSNVSTY